LLNRESRDADFLSAPRYFQGVCMGDPISETVKLLAEFAPQKLDELRARYPEARAALRPAGAVLGASDSDVALAATKEMLGSVAGIALNAAAETGRKLRSASRLDLAGGLLALASSAGVIGTALGSQSSFGTAGFGLVGFMSSAIPLVSRWLRAGLSGDAIGPAFQRLSRAAWDAQVLKGEIERVPANDRSKLEDVIRRANELAGSASQTLTELGYSPSFRPV
jgi:hypothetical protein